MGSSAAGNSAAGPGFGSRRGRARKRKRQLRRLRLSLAAALLQLPRFIPERLGRAIVPSLGRLWARLDPARTTVLRNLDAVFGEALGRQAILRLAEENYAHLLQIGCELVWLRRWNREELLRRVEIEGRECLDEALALGRGVIVITGHMGSWEVSGAAVAQSGYPVHVVSRPQRHSAVEEHLRAARERHHVRLIPDTAPRDCLRCLKGNGMLVLLVDGRARKAGEVVVPFLGRPFPAVAGPARLALKTRAPVLFFEGRRLPGGRFVLRFEPIPLVRTEDLERDIWLNTAQHQQLLERSVRSFPAQHLLWRRPFKEYQADPLYEELTRAGEPERTLRHLRPDLPAPAKDRRLVS